MWRLEIEVKLCGNQSHESRQLLLVEILSESDMILVYLLMPLNCKASWQRDKKRVQGSRGTGFVCEVIVISVTMSCHTAFESLPGDISHTTFNTESSLQKNNKLKYIL